MGLSDALFREFVLFSGKDGLNIAKVSYDATFVSFSNVFSSKLIIQFPSSPAESKALYLLVDLSDTILVI